MHRQPPSGLPSLSTVSICTPSTTGQSIVHDVKIMKDCWVYWENSYTITSFSFSLHSLLLMWIMDSDEQSIRKSTHVCGCSCAGRAVCVAPSLLHPLHQPSVCECNGNSGLGGSYIVFHRLEKNTHTCCMWAWFEVMVFFRTGLVQSDVVQLGILCFVNRTM